MHQENQRYEIAPPAPRNVEPALRMPGCNPSGRILFSSSYVSKTSVVLMSARRHMATMIYPEVEVLHYAHSITSLSESYAHSITSLSESVVSRAIDKHLQTVHSRAQMPTIGCR